jgi:hypothetical protein
MTVGQPVSSYFARRKGRARAVGAVVVSPALQRGLEQPTIQGSPEGTALMPPVLQMFFSKEMKKCKPGATPDKVEFLLPLRQSGGSPKRIALNHFSDFAVLWKVFCQIRNWATILHTILCHFRTTRVL